MVNPREMWAAQAFRFFWLLSTLAIYQAQGADQQFNCPNFPALTEDLPFCSIQENGLVPETAPPLAFVLSADKDPTLVEEFVGRASEAEPLRKPIIVINGASEKMIQHLKGLAHSQTTIISGSKTRWQWQQDYFKPILDSKSGALSLHDLRDYYDHLNLSSKPITNAINQACGTNLIQIGETLPPSQETKYIDDTAYFGGNIEGLPGGWVVHGSNLEWEILGRYYGGDESNSIPIEVSWLEVGHVDEIFGISPDPTQPEGCNYSLNFASPRQALATLKDPKNADQPFFSFDEGSLDPKTKFAGVSHVCKMVRDYRARFNKNAPPKNRDYCKGLKRITNSDVANALEWNGSPEKPGSYNRLIQLELDRAESTVLKKVQTRMGCLPSVHHFPDLFFGGTPIELEHALKLPDWRAKSILPNPTNAVPVGNTVIIPDPHNSAFLEDIRRQLAEKKVSTQTVDTWISGHAQNGNLHCSVNSVRLCKIR